MLKDHDMDADTTSGDDELFLIIAVKPDFGPHAYEATFRLLQIPGRPKLLDLTCADVIGIDLFVHLARAWTALDGSVPRLAISLTFEGWAVLRNAALQQLEPLAVRGVEVAMMYRQQLCGANLLAWFVHGRIVHNAPAVVRSLLRSWRPGSHWRSVLETAIELVRAHDCTAEQPEMLVDLAEIALSCESAEHAEALAREALDRLPTRASALRAKALRELGTALMVRGESPGGEATLDSAIDMAELVQDAFIAATAMFQSGIHAIYRGEYVSAVDRLHCAVHRLRLQPGRRNLLATAHRGLAFALMQLQALTEAEDHALRALELRSDPGGPQSEEDRTLVAKIRFLRTMISN